MQSNPTAAMTLLSQSPFNHLRYATDAGFIINGV
jgi:hypothetical protein